MSFPFQQKVFMARAAAAKIIVSSAVQDPDNVEVVLTMTEAKMVLQQLKALDAEISKLWDLIPEADRTRLAEEMWGDHKREQEQTI